MTASYQVELQRRERSDTAVVRASCSMEQISETLGSIYGEVMQLVQQSGIEASQAFGRYEIRQDGVDIEAGFTVDRPIEPRGRVVAGELPGGEAAVCLHVGSYDTVAQAYDAVQQWLTANGREAAGAPWEVYLTGPEVQPPRTEVVFPLKRP